MCFRRICRTQDLKKISALEGTFSILSGLVPLNFVIQYTTQIGIFLDYLSIKFGEYGYQRNCKVFI